MKEQKIIRPQIHCIQTPQEKKKRKITQLNNFLNNGDENMQGYKKEKKKK